MYSTKLRYLGVVLVVVSSLFVLPAYAQQQWPAWVAELRQEAIAKGIDPALFDKAFRSVTAPSKKVLHYDRTQPEKRLTYIKYRNTRADNYRIKIGQKRLRQNQRLLDVVSSEYGVSPCFIVSIWGLETSYGSFMGSFPVIQSLATLAYDSRRSAFFREQIFYALEILQGGHVQLKDFKGEWAGASGQPQFLPSSWHSYAVDYDGDGHKDIWGNKQDVFASIANYLIQKGWQPHQPWAIEVTLPYHIDEAMLNKKVVKTVGEWRKLGVNARTEPLPANDTLASVIKPYGGPPLMIFNNFKVLLKWNNSIYYAGTVGYMAEKICQRPL